MADVTGFTLRVERRKWQQFLMILAAQETNPTDLFRDYVDKYVAEHIDAARRALDGEERSC